MSEPLSSISQITTKKQNNLLTVTSNTSAIEAISLMSQNKSSFILVTEKQRLFGIVTERDVVKATASGILLEKLSIAEIVTREVIVLQQSEIANIFSVLEKFRCHRVRHLPVVNERGQVIAVLTPQSIRDLLGPKDLLRLRLVEEVMETGVIYLPPSTPVEELAKMMATNQVSCIVIAIDREKQENSENRHINLTNNSLSVMPVGIVTERDIVKLRASQSDLTQTKADSIMGAPLIPVEPKDSLWNAHKKMQEHQIRRLVVTDHNGQLVGLVTQTSVLRMLDPTELYGAIEVLQQTVEEKTVKLQQEIEQRQQLADSLAESEARYRNSEAKLNNILKNVTASICTFRLFANRDWEYEYYSAASETIFGYTPEELIADKYLWMSRIVPEDWETVVLPLFESIFAERTLNYEYRFKHKDGTLRWLSANLNSKKIASDCWYATVVAIDITERKQSEEQLKEVNIQLNSWIEELETRNQEITLLGEMNHILQACLTVEEAYKVVEQLMPQLFPQTSGELLSVNFSTKIVESVLRWGCCSLVESQLFTPNDCWGLRLGRTHFVKAPNYGLLCNHYKHLEEANQLPAELLCVPTIAQGETLGVLYLSSQKPDCLTPSKQQLASTVAENISLALANLRLRQQLQEQSICDPLTGLFNRRYMEASLQREIHRCDRLKKPLGIIAIDIDRFKHFNDEFGHDAGDLVLQELGNFLQSQIRGADIACRYGGEELVLILPETGLEDLRMRAEQIREGVKELRLQHNRQLLDRITISLGIACFPEHGLTPKILLKAADTSLYAAKQQGRDRVVSATITNNLSE
jgi:diguanylate cyclase (GGDEF)-like protein/PAS domain S-box-containing protein